MADETTTPEPIPTGELLDGLDPAGFTVTEEAPAEPAATTEAVKDEKADDKPADDAADATTEGVTEEPDEAAGDEDDAAEEAEKTDEPEAAEAPKVETVSTPTEPQKQAESTQQQTREQRAARLAQLAGEIAALETRLDADDYDPYVDGRKLNKLQAEQGRLQSAEVDDLRAENDLEKAKSRERDLWAAFAAQHPTVGKRGEAIWKEELAAAQAKYPGKSPDAVHLVASERFEHRIGTIEGKQRAAAADAPPARKAPPTPSGAPLKPAANKGGGRIVPPAAGGGARAAAPKTPEELLVSSIAGGVRGFLD